MRKMKFYTSFILVLYLCGCFSTSIKYSHNHDGKLVYISENSRDKFSVPDFPAVDSEEYKNDFEILHEWQGKRNNKQCLEADSQQYASLQEFFPEYSEFFSSLSNKDKKFIYRVYEDAQTININVKSKYSRPRPFNSDSTLQPCENIGRICGYAYPSGHATMAGLFEKFMIQIDPENNEKIHNTVIQAGLNRVIAGVHHPSDIKTGMALGEDIFNEMRKNPKFKKKLVDLHVKFLKFKNKK